MNYSNLLKAIILIIVGMLLFTLYIYKSEKRENILNWCQSAKIIGSFEVAIIMILFGLNEILK